MSMLLTQDQFEEFKKDYAVYGTHTELDPYRNEKTIKNDSPRGTVHTMWHPMTGTVAFAEYGRDISSMLYSIVYDNPGIEYNDIIEIYGDEYEVVGIKIYNTHVRIDVKRKKA